VAARITPLRLESFEQLPKHARRCVYWEVDPSTLRADDHLSDPEFEKEAWLSMVMLEWGSCGQMAVYCRDTGPMAGDIDDPAMPLDAGDSPCLGYAFYAPPGAVPRARRFPTGPVSADAVLLTSMGVESDVDGLARHLMTSVVGDLVRRGVGGVRRPWGAAAVQRWGAGVRALAIGCTGVTVGGASRCLPMGAALRAPSPSPVPTRPTGLTRSRPAGAGARAPRRVRVSRPTRPGSRHRGRRSTDSRP